MDSPTGFDDDDFFGKYDAEKAHAATSVTPLEFDEDDRPPTREQLAHWGRFRKPVGLVVGAMALLSVLALVKVGSREQDSERQLVAHYGSAIAAVPPRTIATRIEEPRAPDSVAPDTSSDLLPPELSSFVAEVWSMFVPKEPPYASTTVPLLITDENDSALEPPSPTAAPTESSAAPPRSSGATFGSTPAPMCLRPAEGGARADSCDACGRAAHASAPPAFPPGAAPGEPR